MIVPAYRRIILMSANPEASKTPTKKLAFAHSRRISYCHQDGRYRSGALALREENDPGAAFLFFQVDVMNVFDCVPQKAFAHVAELLHGVGGEKL